MVVDRNNTLPFFATNGKSIEFVGNYNVYDKCEAKLMDSRLRLFRFTKRIPKKLPKYYHSVQITSVH